MDLLVAKVVGWLVVAARLLHRCCATATPLLQARFPPGGDVFCQIILLYRFITAIKAKPSLTMHQIQGSSLKVHSEPVFAGSLSLNRRRVIAFGKLGTGGGGE